MKRKINRLVILFCLILNLSECQQSKKANDKNFPTKIVILFSDFTSTRIVAISCDEFEATLGVNLKKYEIADTKKIDSIYRELQSLTPLNYTPALFDTRAKIINFYPNQTIDTICVGKTKTKFRDKFYKTSNQLRSFLSNQM